MAFTKIVLALALLVLAAQADDLPRSYSAPTQLVEVEQEDSAEPAKYEFEWQVDAEGNKYSQAENRDGDKTRGSYVVELPDGRRQTVTYSVDGDSGYVADVKYSGEAQYPEPQLQESQESEEQRTLQQSYQAPPADYDL